MMGFSVGVSFGTGVRVSYGLDVRMVSGRRAAFVRVEARGLSSARIVAGAHARTEGDIAAEAGLALHSEHQDSDIGRALALHLAGGAYASGFGAQLQGSLPFLGDLRNYEGNTSLVIIPDEWPELCLAGGRRLRDGDAAVLPGVATFDDCDAIAHAWIEDARAEYASIWAFERMAAELRAAGAPGALIAAARTAAEDEARHVALCGHMANTPFHLLPLARAYAEPRFTTPSHAALATLAREAWVDGCLGEGVAAAHAASAARTAREKGARVQHMISVDERRHADLAWAVLDWTWREGGTGVRDAIVDAASAEPEVPVPALDGDPELHVAAGRVSPAAGRAAAEREIDEALARVRRLVS